MALADYALTTVANIRRVPALKKLPSDAETTGWIEDTINGYSLALKHWTGREFKPKTPGGADPEGYVERKFTYDGGGWLSLEPYEARALEWLKLYVGTLAAQTVPAADWRAFASLEAEKTEEGTYLNLELRSPITDISGLTTVHESHWSARWTVGVSARWGAGVTPSAIELACRIAVAKHLLSPEGFARRSLGEYEFDEGVDTLDEFLQALPKASRNLARPYQRQRAKRRHRTSVSA